jgi:Na+(H+)/acetate symporter ActP
MTATPAALAGLFVMLLITLGAGVYARRIAHSTSDFLVAARAVRPVANAAAISGEYLSAASFLGVAGLVMKFGYDAMWYPVGYAAGYLVLLIFIAGPLRRFGAYTIPDFAEGRFDSPRFRRLAVGLVLVIGLFYALPQMKAAGITVASASGAPYATGVVLIGAVVVAIVAAGGMRGITMVQAIQFGAKVFAIVAPLFILLALFGPPAQLFERLSRTPQAQEPRPTVLEVSRGQAWTLREPLRVHVDPGTRALAGPPAGAAGYAFEGVTIPRPPEGTAQREVEVSGDATLPAGRLVWEGAATVRLPAGAPVPYGDDTPLATTSAWLAPFGPLAGRSGAPLLFTYSLIIAIVCGTMGLPHILVRFYTNPDARAARRTALATLVLVSSFYLWTPLWGLLGRLESPQLYAGPGRTDDVVLLLPRLLTGPAREVLTAVVAAGAFAAFTSTLSGLLVSLAGALGHDVYGRWLRPHAGPTARRRAFRAGAVIAGAAAAGLGLLVGGFDISILVGWAFAIAASSFFPLLVLGIWWPRLTTAGAAAGAATGGLAATGGIVVTMLGSASPQLARFLAEHSWLAVVLAQPAILTIPVAFAVMVGVSLARPARPAPLDAKMLQLHLPDRLGLRRDYIPD